MTEDSGIESYPERKAEHRSRVARDRRVAAIYAADKLASTRHISEPEDVPPQQARPLSPDAAHALPSAIPDLPFIGELQR